MPVFINAHERAYTLLGKLGAAALLQAAPTRMGKEVLALQGLFKDKNKVEQLLVHDDMRDIVKSFDATGKETFETMKMLVFNSNEWCKLEVFLMSCELSMSALRLVDQDAPTLPFVAEAYYKTLRESSLQLQARDSDDDTAPSNGFDDILNEVCEEAGYESDESDHEGAW